jgi:hypothetical protein
MEDAMKKLFALLSTLVVLPVFAADEYSVPAAAAPPTAAQPIAQPKSTESVARAQFTSAIQDREPVDKVTKLLNDKTSIYYFSEIKDAPNQKVTHRWEHDGKVVHEMSFDIGGERWRVYSNKTLDPNQTGEWKVTVVDANGGTLGANTFTYEAATAAPAQPAAAQPAAAQPAAAQPAAAQPAAPAR